MSAAGVSEAAALSEPGVVAELARYRLRAVLTSLGGVALLVVFVVGAVVVDDRLERLERIGVRVPGRVSEVDKALVFSHTVRVAFEYAEMAREAVINLDDESPVYEIGDEVTVLVDPADDDVVTLPGEANQSPWTSWPMVASLIVAGAALGAGVGGLFRVRIQRRVLRRNPWRRMPFHYCELPGPRRSVRPVAMVDDGTAGQVVKIGCVWRWRLKRLGVRDVDEIDVAGTFDRSIVLRADANTNLVSARRPWTERGERRLRRRICEQRSLQAEQT